VEVSGLDVAISMRGVGMNSLLFYKVGIELYGPSLNHPHFISFITLLNIKKPPSESPIKTTPNSYKQFSLPNSQSVQMGKPNALKIKHEHKTNKFN
jgi:hypothetical protein